MGYERSAGWVVAVVDSDVAVRAWLAANLGPACFQVLTFTDGGEFIQSAQHCHADCVMLDAHLPDHTGLEVLKAIGGATYLAPVIMTSDQVNIPMVVSAIKAGAHDLLEKPFDRLELITTIREAVRSRPRPTPSRAALLQLADAAELTTSEVEVLEQIAAGRSNKEAGLVLRLPPATVEVHRTRAMKKLKVHHTADLMRLVLAIAAPA